MIRVHYRSVTLLLALVTLVAGCGVQSQRPSQLFVLAPTASATVVATSSKPPALVIGPINLPAYTERTAILSLQGPSALVAAPAARWAEPLDKNFARVLVENISLLLNNEQVTALGGVTAADHVQVVIDVTEFVATADGQALLTAYWQILGSDGHSVLASHKTHYQEAAQDKGTGALVAAMSRTLASLSKDIAQAVSAAQVELK